MSPAKIKPQHEVSRCGVTDHSPQSAAEGHAISTTEIYRALKSGALPGRKRGRAWIIRCEDVEAWIDETSVPNSAELERGA